MSSSRRKVFAHKREPKQSRRERVMEYLRAFESKNQRSPSIREICKAVGISSTSIVTGYLHDLEQEGRIVLEQGIARSILIVDWGAEQVMTGEICRIPVKGQIVAGYPRPIPAGAESDCDFVSLPRERLSRGDLSSIYALRVKGDSMIDALVGDGDLVILRHQQEAQNGEMVAAHLRKDDEDKFTLKYYHWDGGNQVVLKPANPNYAPIPCSAADVEIQGKVILILRQY